MTARVRTPLATVVVALAATGAVLLMLAAALLVLPTSAHVPVPNDDSEWFYGCGVPAHPTAEPREEPGISACNAENAAMRGRAAVAAGAGAVTLSLAALAYGAARRRTRAREPHRAAG